MKLKAAFLFLPLLLTFSQVTLSQASTGLRPVSEIHTNSNVLIADQLEEGDQLARGYLARIAQNSPQELETALKRAEMLFLEGTLKGEADPAVFVIHGPEVAVFFRENYFRYRSLIDLAARLSAFGVIDIRVCETRMGVLGRERGALMPFIGTVPFGPAEEERLLTSEGYVHF